MTVGTGIDQLHVDPHFVAGFLDTPSKTVATPSCCETVFKSSGLLLYFAVEVREMTLRSAIVASFVRISS